MMSFPFLWTPRWMMGLGVFAILAVVIGLYHLLNSKHSTAEKLLWAIIIIALNMIGVLLYLIFAKKMSTHEKHPKRLFRSKDNTMIAGVCGGIGEYLDVDPTIVRLVWAIFCLAAGAGIVAYLVAWFIIPKKN